MIDAFVHTAGRLHPMMVHVPIGLLLGLGAWELWRALRGRRAPGLGSGVVFMAWLGVAGAAGAIATGLAHEAELGEDPAIALHKWLGIGCGVGVLLTAIGATVVWGTESSDRPRGARRGVRMYRLVLFSTLGVLIPAGHFGGTLTHGEGYVLAPLAQELGLGGGGGDVAEPRQSPDSASVALLGVQAREILASKCASCHGPVRSRGGLRVDSDDALLAPGREGTPVVPGDPGASLILVRMRLPLEDRDHMPPRGKPQPTPEEIAAIDAWIRSMGGGGVTPVASAPRVGSVVPDAAPAMLRDPGTAEPGAIEAIRAALGHVQPLASGSNLLWVDLSILPGLDDAATGALLSPIREQIAELSLARTSIGDASLATAGSMPRLVRLDVSGTSISDAGVARLGGHPSLETLVLAGTGVTDASVAMIASMPRLRRVYLWGTGVSDEAITWLALACPELQVDTGRTGSEAIESEPAVVVGVPAGGAPSVPINTVCPVTGSPADARFVLVYEGRTVAFCCENCPKQFAADPARFAGNLPE